jgi:hypothetical protein
MMLMKRIVSFIISILFCATIFAQNVRTYQIKNLNTQSIEIGGKRLKVGDRFKSTEKIKWTSDDQVFEAVDNTNYAIHVFSAKALKSKKANNISDYLVNITHASTRDINAVNWTVTRSENSSKFTDRRIALLIANTNYFHLSKLRNPVYDNEALSKKLLELGFDVYTVFDCDHELLRNTIIKFSKEASNYNLALFFYSGHGTQCEGENYLVPVNLELDDKSELSNCIKCEFVRNQLDRSKCSNRIILFDACRNERDWSRDITNSWGQMEGSLGTYISFSTKSGKTASDGDKGENSPYTTALLNHIATPNRELTLVMGDVVRETSRITDAIGNRQEPTVSGTFRNEIYLNPIQATPTSQVSVSSNLPVEQANKLSEEEEKPSYSFTFNDNPDGIGQYKLGEIYYNSQNYTKAVEHYKKAAKKGYSKAEWKLGYCYENGQGVPQDYEAAASWYNIAALTGNVNAQNCLGIYYYKGQGVSQNYKKAIEWWRKAAERGDAAAQCNLGICYENGQGVSQNNEKAAEWYRKAAEQGEATAQCNLGICYKNGQGVPQDYEKAVYWYRKAAEQGDAIAQCNLGVCYENGQGISQNNEKAAEWYRKAAEQGEAAAQGNLGICYSNGQGVPQDYEKAVYWYRKAAEQGNATAQRNLGICYENGQGVSQNNEKAAEWYRKAAEQGNATAQCYLGICYTYGQGVPQDYEKAVYWYRKAEEQGDATAQRNLGICYFNGDGVPKNYAKAVELLKKAANQGNEKAKSMLKELGEL